MYAIEKLIEYGVIGFYKSCEAVQIFLVDRSDESLINFYTIFTFEEKDYSPKNKESLTEKLIPIDKNFSMGIQKHHFSLDDSIEIFYKLHNSKWEKDKILLNGFSFKLLQNQYIPFNKYNRINNILKNSFFRSSYLFEFFEEDKSVFNYFKENPEKLDEVINNIYELLPIDFSLNKDRIGNYIFQLPINLLKIKTNPNDDYTGFFIEFIWNNKLSNRIPECIINSSIKIEDNFLSNVLDEYNKENSQLIKIGPLDKIANLAIWRLNPNLLLYNNNLRFPRKVYGGVIPDEGTRLFYDRGVEKTIKLKGALDYEKDYEKYIQIVDDTKSEITESDLEKDCSFKLYGSNRSNDVNHLECLVNLIQRHGSNGVYLLDPYLTYEEILSTLYYSDVANVPLRAITSKKVLNNYNDDVNINDVDDFIELNKEKFEKLSNNLNLNLEFRIERGENSFHDRFLIFPKNPKKLEKPLVYSLGASINGFGKSYHILQEIPTPNKIVKLFNDLWEKLDDKELYLVWKTS